MNVLVLNAGSSSVKFRCYRGEECVMEGAVERIGNGPVLVLDGMPSPVQIGTHEEAGREIFRRLPFRPDCVLHRIVHGGTRASPAIADDRLIDELAALIPLSPLHQKHALSLLRQFRSATGAPAIACFDTMFHRTMPAAARTYAIPAALARKHRIERYGFHGIAHEAMAHEAARLMGRDMRALNIITCQLGSGVSLCAIRAGRSIDTTMGFTPLEGLPMGTRSGSIDPAIIPFLCQNGYTPAQVLRILEEESGLRGIAGRSDVRDLLAAEGSDADAGLALDVLAYRIRQQIGAYAATLGRVDAVVLGGGVAHSAVMRRRILSGLERLGIVLDDVKLGLGAPCHVTCGPLPVYVLDANEEDHMLRLALPLLQGLR